MVWGGWINLDRAQVNDTVRLKETLTDASEKLGVKREESFPYRIRKRADRKEGGQ